MYSRDPVTVHAPRPCRRAWLAGVLLAVAAHGAIAMDVQGHRGARGHFPENTLEGFARVLDRRADWGVTTLELDTGVTRDGVVVISHDQHLNPEITRTADGRWLSGTGPALVTLDHAALAAWDVGRIDPASGYARRFPRQQPIDGARIPRLDALFALVAARGDTTVRFNIETKIDPTRPAASVGPEAFARALVGEIRKAGVASRTTIQSFDWRTLAVVAREAPEIARAYLTAEATWSDTVVRDGASPWTAGVRFADHGSVPRMVRAAGGRIWSPWFGNLDRAVVAEARALGIAVLPWTVNEPDDIARVLALGVDGVISDYPDRVRAALRR
jgi:glycerophosphoryl diester phosphodiesterase